METALVQPAARPTAGAAEHPVDAGVTIPRARRTHYVYLIVSDQDHRFKLGHTHRLRGRVHTLRKLFGSLREQDSYVINVGSRAVARWVEAELKAAFRAPCHRASAPIPHPRRGPGNPGGYLEWYRLCAFTQMQAALLRLVQRAGNPRHPEYDACAPFEAPYGATLAEALHREEQPPDARSFAERITQDLAREQQAEAEDWLDDSECRARGVRAWTFVRSDWLVATGPLVHGPNLSVHRTLYYSLQSKEAEEPSPEELERGLGPPAMDWRELYSLACFRLRRRDGTYLERRYCEPVPASRSGGTLAVRFGLDDTCTLRPDAFDPPTELPRRLYQWLLHGCLGGIV